MGLGGRADAKALAARLLRLQSVTPIKKTGIFWHAVLAQLKIAQKRGFTGFLSSKSSKSWGFSWFLIVPPWRVFLTLVATKTGEK